MNDDPIPRLVVLKDQLVEARRLGRLYLGWVWTECGLVVLLTLFAVFGQRLTGFSLALMPLWGRLLLESPIAIAYLLSRRFKARWREATDRAEFLLARFNDREENTV